MIMMITKKIDNLHSYLILTNINSHPIVWLKKSNVSFSLICLCFTFLFLPTTPRTRHNRHHLLLHHGCCHHCHYLLLHHCHNRPPLPLSPPPRPSPSKLRSSPSLPPPPVELAVQTTSAAMTESLPEHLTVPKDFNTRTTEDPVVAQWNIACQDALRKDAARDAQTIASVAQVTGPEEWLADDTRRLAEGSSAPYHPTKLLTSISVRFLQLY